MATTATTTKTVISDKSAKAVRLLNNAHAKSAITDIKKAQANDLDEDEDEVNEPEVKVDDKAIQEAREALEKAKANYEHAKTALAQLIGKPLKISAGPGVIASILDILKKSPQGVTKDEILVELVQIFPEREKEGMAKTISVQLPQRMAREKKVNIVKTEEGKFILK